MRKNSLKASLKSGGSAAGVIIPSADEQLVEVLGLAGFPWVFIDCEHGHMSVRECETLVRAAEAVNVTPIVRVPHNEPDVILRHLDTGAQGVVVPQVITVDDVERAIQAARYYPSGQRGLAGTRAASYGLGAPLGEYVQTANEEIMVIALIENARAVENLPQILQVEGLDAITIGPADLSQSLGRPGDRNHPDVEGAITEIINQAVSAGVPVGLNTSTGEDARAARERGCRITTVSAWGLLAQSARNYLSAIQ